MTDSIRVISISELNFKGSHYRCCVGENGFTNTPKEGAKATPVGKFSIRECWYRADRMPPPETSLPLRIIQPDDGWCDDPAHPDYNRPVKLPFAASHERLWHDDRTYDIIVPIGFNDNPVVPGKGSAIFFHLARPGYMPTLGCVAVVIGDMLKILRNVTLESQFIIAPTPKIAKSYQSEQQFK